MVAANGIYKLAVLGTSQGQQHIHTLHFRSTVDPDGLLMSEDAWQAALVALWQGTPRTAFRNLFQASESPVQSYQVRKVCGAVPLPAGLDVAESVGNQNGTQGLPEGDALAPWLAQVVTLRSALAGRRYRGRSFIGGLREENVLISTITGARTTRMTAYADALRTVFVTPADADIEAKLFVFSRLLANGDPTRVPPVLPVACQDAGANVTTLQVRDQLATMKSRKQGSGI